PFYGDADGVGGFHHLAGDGDVILQERVETVRHYATEAVPDALHGLLETGPVVQVQGYGHVHLRGSHPGQGGDVVDAGILDGALAGLQDDGRPLLLGRRHDGLQDLHVVDVERTDGVVAPFG